MTTQMFHKTEGQGQHFEFCPRLKAKGNILNFADPVVQSHSYDKRRIIVEVSCMDSAIYQLMMHFHFILLQSQVMCVDSLVS